MWNNYVIALLLVIFKVGRIIDIVKTILDNRLEYLWFLEF